MKSSSVFGEVLAAALLFGMAVVPGAVAQQATGDGWCREESWQNDRQRFCEVRQFTVAATGGVLTVQGTNGGIQVNGEARADVQILARIVATADDTARARQIAGAVRLTPTIDHVEAEGPSGLPGGEGWSVSYRLAVPRGLNLSLNTVNGGILIEDVDAKVEFATTNGGVKLRSLSGDVRGRTTNGGLDVDLDGSSWSGDGLDVQTTNGGIRLAIPENYSAQLEAHTQNGGMNVDVPGVEQAGRRTRDVSVRLGAGGAPIRVRTSNGGVRVTRK